MILIGLGSNLPSQFGSPMETLEEALIRLDDHADIKVLAKSKWYRSDPVGIIDQPVFVNGAARLETSLDPLTLLTTLLQTEDGMGRVRSKKWGPRSVDLDLIDYEGKIGTTSSTNLTLHLPHPRAVERAFVLVPLQEIAPDWKDPVTGVTIESLLEKLNPNEIAKISVVSDE